MSLADLSIKRPAFITSIIVLSIAIGLLAFKKLGVDLFPNASFPVVTVTIPYPGAGSSEVETLVSRVLEDEISSLSGIKSLRSISKEGVGTVITEFTLETDLKDAEQQIRDRISSAKRKLPSDILEPTVRRLDPGDQAILVLSVSANLDDGKLYELADQKIKPLIEQLKGVGLVEILGGRKREILVELDRTKLSKYELSASQVVSRLNQVGLNVPAGKVSSFNDETIIRTLGEFKELTQIENTIINFMGNDVPISVKNVGGVKESLQDEKMRSYVNGDRSLFVYVYRQSGANTIAVADSVKGRIEKLNKQFANDNTNTTVSVVRDRSKQIKLDVSDVEEAIYIGIILTVLVVFFFLGNIRSTIITGLALPNSLIGAFILMAVAGFTINIMSLLAMSLAVGLLIDDAIVVRENIFRYIEEGFRPIEAALKGTTEVSLPVIATTLTIISVFGPIAFLDGVIGRFFREFGLTVVFAMLISLYDALTIAPMLSAYMAGSTHENVSNNFFSKLIYGWVRSFGRFQDKLDNGYAQALKTILSHPIKSITISFAVFLLSLFLVKGIPKTFLPAQEMGEFELSLDLPPGTSLNAMNGAALEVDRKIREIPEIERTVLTVGNKDGEPNVADYYVELVNFKKRLLTTSQVKEKVRTVLKDFRQYNPRVKDVDRIGAGQRPFNVNVISQNQLELEETSNKLFAFLKQHSALKDVDISFRPGKPEFQIKLDDEKSKKLGIASNVVGRELRAQVEGIKASVFRENGQEYDVRVRLKENQRNLKSDFSKITVPNVNNFQINLSDIAEPVTTLGPSSISRQDRGRYIQISADLDPSGPGMGAVMADVDNFLKPIEEKNQSINHKFVGQAENFMELKSGMITAVLLGVFFIYLVLTSLYESFVTPLTIMLVLPLAASGAFISLWLANSSLNIYSMIGTVMLLGVATKNSILLVDTTKHYLDQNFEMTAAIIAAGKKRLRPILMTSFALIAGTVPLAIGLNEASKQRTSMGIAVIGGLVSSTLLTLVVVPAAYTFIDKFRVWSLSKAYEIGGTHKKERIS